MRLMGPMGRTFVSRNIVVGRNKAQRGSGNSFLETGIVPELRKLVPAYDLVFGPLHTCLKGHRLTSCNRAICRGYLRSEPMKFTGMKGVVVGIVVGTLAGFWVGSEMPNPIWKFVGIVMGAGLGLAGGLIMLLVDYRRSSNAKKRLLGGKRCLQTLQLLPNPRRRKNNWGKWRGALTIVPAARRRSARAVRCRGRRFAGRRGARRPGAGRRGVAGQARHGRPPAEAAGPRPTMTRRRPARPAAPSRTGRRNGDRTG